MQTSQTDQKKEEEKKEIARKRRFFYSFIPGMTTGAVLGLVLAVAITFAFYYGWFPLALMGQFFTSGIYPALIAASAVGVALGCFLGALTTWKRE